MTKIFHWIYYVKINVSIKQRIVRRKGAFKERQLCQAVFIPERGMGTPLYKPYIQCMCRPKSYGFLRRLGQKTGINLSPILIWNRVRF